MGDRLSKPPKVRKYSSLVILHRRRLNLHPAFADFVSGPKCGFGNFSFCPVCRRDVGMKAHGSGEFARLVQSVSHWFKDVTYLLHMNLPVLYGLMEPMELSASELTEYRARSFEDLAEGYPFPEDLLPKHVGMDSKVLFMMLVGCVCQLLHSGGDCFLLWRLWSHFLSSLSKKLKPHFNLNWRSSETPVSMH